MSKPHAGVLPPTPTIQVTNAFCVFPQLLTPELAGVLGAPFLLKTVTILGVTIPDNGLELHWDGPVRAQLPSRCVHFSHLPSFFPQCHLPSAPTPCAWASAPFMEQGVSLLLQPTSNTSGSARGHSSHPLHKPLQQASL